MVRNPYNVRNEEGLFYILPQHLVSSTYSYDDKKVGVVIYLYYFDDIEWYIRYVKRIPNWISILIISSSEKIIDYFQKHFGNQNNIRTISQENRGRDIAAFLVSAKEFVSEKDYILFLHDKKSKSKYEEQDVWDWTFSMWENTVANENYVCNVIGTFEDNDEIGLLFPMLNVGKHRNLPYLSAKDGWGKNFSITIDIAKRIGLGADVDIDENIPPISYGTIFWFRTDALKKLLDYPWKNGDFSKEPLPNDGTISHAIERILPYVAADAGYKTGTIMTDKFAASFLGHIDRFMNNIWKVANTKLGVHSPYQIEDLENEEKRIVEYFSNKDSVYIYGAGQIGNMCYQFLKEIIKESPSGFVDKSKCGKRLKDLPIISVDEFKNLTGYNGLIIAVGPKLKTEVIQYLTENYINDYIFYLLD